MGKVGKKLYISGAFPGDPNRAELESLAADLKAEGYTQQHWARPLTREDDGMPERFEEERQALLEADLAVLLFGTPRTDAEQLIAVENQVPHLQVYPAHYVDQDPFVYHAVTRREGPRSWSYQVGTLGRQQILEILRGIFGPGRD